jgi:hypothetical protein
MLNTKKLFDELGAGLENFRRKCVLFRVNPEVGKAYYDDDD